MSKDHLVIDAHAHLGPPALLEELESRTCPVPSVQVFVGCSGMRLARAGNEFKRSVMAAMSDADQRRRQLAAQGVDKQVAGGWVDMSGHELPPEEGADWRRLLNDTVVYDTRTPRFVCDMATPGKVLMGTDQPFAIAEQKPIQFIDSCDFRRCGTPRHFGRHRCRTIPRRVALRPCSAANERGHDSVDERDDARGCNDHESKTSAPVLRQILP